MKHFSFIISICFFTSLYSQEDTRIVVDAETNKPVSYATVSILNRLIGLITSSDGIFKMKFEANDSILVTSAGYEAFLTLGKNVKDTIRLKRKFVSLSPVSIYTKPFATVKLGNGKIKKGIWSWLASENHEFAQKMFTPSNGSTYKMRKIFVPVDKRTKCPGLLLLRVYLADTIKNIPGEEVLSKLIVTDDSLIRKGILRVDISLDNLFFSKSDSFFVGITWPPGSLESPCKTLLRLSKYSNSETYYRYYQASSNYSFQWFRKRKMSDMKGVEFDMNCFFSAEADVYK